MSVNSNASSSNAKPIFKHPVTIREQHLDSYGQVNTAIYLTLFEEARWELITQGEYGYQQVHDRKVGPIILEINLKFLKEIKLRENITITVELMSYEGKIAKLKQLMLKSNGDIAAELICTVALFDLTARKMILPTPEWLKAIGHY